ncbi:hypothetical protein [Methylobacterium pseudosasicola]|uniref:Uncharacterized protein n=1 Tax=Methylobacterium pseudosasicola TaxID=582667 RepID=A0A1I4MS31_9HYPH|nr:hypothetical protein [Methylobacterium pseudosasicola]SFM06059.1 hypothetical protein SAMN05192568_10184 [Methylobacterium pseudosasicola]
MAMPPLASMSAQRRPTTTVYARPAPMLDINEDVPGTVEAWEAVAPIRPDTAYVRAPRFLDLAGELLTATLIIAGGVFAYGFMPVA